MQVKIGITFHRDEISYFEMNRLYIICLRQADSASRLYLKEFIFDKSSSLKLTIYQKVTNSNGNTFSFIPHVCYSSYHPSIAASKTRSLTTLLSTKMKVEEIQPQEHQHTCLSNCSRNNRHHYSCMLVKSFIWLTRVWFHRMFRSRVEYF